VELGGNWRTLPRRQHRGGGLRKEVGRVDLVWHFQRVAQPALDLNDDDDDNSIHVTCFPYSIIHIFPPSSPPGSSSRLRQIPPAWIRVLCTESMDLT
jgi:hypothetical protein